MNIQSNTGQMRLLDDGEMEQVSGGWDFRRYGIAFDMPADIVVYGPTPSIGGGVTGWDWALGGGSGGYGSSLSGLDLNAFVHPPANDQANATKPANQHAAPQGYHFSEMDPTGEHYMVKDGDASNALHITPWYQEKIDSQHTNWNGVVSDLVNIGIGAISGAGDGFRAALGIGLGVYNFAFPK